MMAAKWLHVPNLVSLGVIAGVLCTAVVASLLKPPEPPGPPSSCTPSGSA